MITLVIPSRNRAHTLRIVGESFYRQEKLSEIIFVLDASTDDSEIVIDGLARAFPTIRTVVLKNESRQGAPYNRIKGYKAATNEFVAFSDDDTYIEPNYFAVCLQKLLATGAAFVSGRLITKLPHQSFEQAIANFGNGTSDGPLLKPEICELRHSARFTGDVKLPFTVPVGITRKELLERFSYDPYYCRGNGYREETDFQMNAFVNGYDIIATNDVHYVELSRWENRSGGQRMSRAAQLYWSIYYTNYFFGKYYDRYAQRLGLKTGRRMALVRFAFQHFYALFIRPVRRLPYLISLLALKPAAAPQAPAR
jgi:glycosyltransferase involved in cell wall biosynthesis